MGYDVKHAHIANEDFDAYINRGVQVPDVILVSKSHAEKRQKRRTRGGQRTWKVRKLDMEAGESAKNPEHEDQQMEQFLDVSII